MAAIGRANFVPGHWIKEGAVVIDCGINAVPDSTKKAGHRYWLIWPRCIFCAILWKKVTLFQVGWWCGLRRSFSQGLPHHSCPGRGWSNDGSPPHIQRGAVSQTRPTSVMNNRHFSHPQQSICGSTANLLISHISHDRSTFKINQKVLAYLTQFNFCAIL